MFINKYLTKSLTFFVLAIFAFGSKAFISSVELDDKFEAVLTIKEVNTNTLPVSLLLELKLRNLTQQTLIFQRKKVESMMTIIVYDKFGRTLNRNEITAKVKRRGDKVFEFVAAPEETATFARHYVLQDYFKVDAGNTEVFIQAHHRLTQSNSEQILIGRIKSNKIKVTPAMLSKPSN